MTSDVTAAALSEQDQLVYHIFQKYKSLKRLFTHDGLAALQNLGMYT